jgi:hypothetical protein
MPRFENPTEQENLNDQLEALKAAMAEAEDLLAEFAIEMRMQAREALLRAEQLSDELGEHRER